MDPFEVPADELIKAIAVDLKEKFKVEQPAFAMFVKTGCSRDRVPQQPDWYYTRLASLLYRVFKEGRVGVGSLRTYYGGRKNRGRRKHKFRRAGGKIIRFGLQQLEQLGFIQKSSKGRIIAKKGQSYLSKKAAEVKKRLEAEEKLKAQLEAKESAEAPKEPQAKRQAVSEKKEPEAREKGTKEKKSAEVIAELKKKLESEHSIASAEKNSSKVETSKNPEKIKEG